MKNIIKIKKETENLTELIYDILENLPENCENVIEFEKGTYHFHRKGSKKMQLFSSGGLSVENYVVFPIIEKKNLTIDGNGSEFVFCDRVQPIIAQCCENITFKNFSMDYSFLRYAYGDIIAIDENGFEIEMDRDMFSYYIDGNCLCFKCGEDILSTKTRRLSVKRIAPTTSRAFHFSIGDTLAERSGAAPNILVDAEKISGGIRFTYRPETEYTNFQKGDRICIAYDNNREAQAFWCERSKNINVKNVTIYRGGGMGFVADLCEEILLDGYKIELKKGREEYYTTTADGVFITNCKGKFTMCNSHISDTYDDAMNIHGYYTVVDEIIDKRTVKIIHPHPSHVGIIPCFKGDEIHFSTTDNYDDVGSAVVENITYDEMRENIVITFDRDVELKKGMLLENPSRMPDVLLENNVVEHCPHIRLSSKNMVVRNNKLYLNAFDLYIHDLIAFWGECGATDNVLIENNVFGNAEHNLVVRSSRPETSNHLHKNITVRNNTFIKKQEEAIIYEKVENFVMENNNFGE